MYYGMLPENTAAGNLTGKPAHKIPPVISKYLSSFSVKMPFLMLIRPYYRVYISGVYSGERYSAIACIYIFPRYIHTDSGIQQLSAENIAGGRYTAVVKGSILFIFALTRAASVFIYASLSRRKPYSQQY